MIDRSKVKPEHLKAMRDVLIISGIEQPTVDAMDDERVMVVTERLIEIVIHWGNVMRITVIEPMNQIVASVGSSQEVRDAMRLVHEVRVTKGRRRGFS